MSALFMKMANVSPIHTNGKYQPYSYKWLMSALFIEMANVSPIEMAKFRNG